MNNIGGKEMKPQIQIKSVEMGDPTFEGGAVKIASANLHNPTAKQFTYEVELYLATDAQGINKVATSGVGAITVAAGATVPTGFTLTMPLAEAEYHVFVNVKVASVPLVLYKAVENVVIQISPRIEVGPITWG